MFRVEYVLPSGSTFLAPNSYRGPAEAKQAIVEGQHRRHAVIALGGFTHVNVRRGTHGKVVDVVVLS